MAEFGDEEAGVYAKRFIEMAVSEGKRIGHRYITDYTQDELREFLSKPRRGPRILGVDNDKVQAGCTLVCVELNKDFINVHGDNEPKFEVIFRVEIPKSQFTYINEVNKIVELNEIYDFDWIAMDRGYGSLQFLQECDKMVA